MSDMNENAELYVQQVLYNEEIGPYQCLAKPWWARTKNQMYWPRHGCILEPLVCGEAVFGRIAQDLAGARRTVDIITWGFDPGMVLERASCAEDGLRYGDLLKNIATNKEHPVTVRLLLWHDDVLAHYHAKNNPGLFGSRLPTIGGYAGFFSEAHDRYNHAWFDEVLAGEVPNIILHVRKVPLGCVAPALAGESYKSSAAGKVGALYPTHHQKMVLIDYEVPHHAVGYVMGHNSTTDFWDTEKHHFRDPRRETLYEKNPRDAQSQLDALWDSASNWYHTQMDSSSHERASQRQVERSAAFAAKYGFTAKPYQDVSLRVRGPILCDLNHNFCDGWHDSGPPGATVKHAVWMSPSILDAKASSAPVTVSAPAQLSAFIQSRLKFKSDQFRVPGGQHSAQLLRTQPIHREKSIKECYANLNRQVEHYIFIQNQYIQYEDWAKHLCDCAGTLRKAGFTEPIYAFIVTSTPEADGMDIATYDVAKNLAQSASMDVEHAEALKRAKQGKSPFPITADELAGKGIRALMASMWTCAENPRSADDYEEIYIHAKVAIVDDAAFTIGSANLNVRSMAMDSELNVLSQAKDVALELRKKLFRQCIGDDGPPQFGDISSTFKIWSDLMEDNASARQKMQPFTGKILPFHVNRKPGAPVI